MRRIAARAIARKRSLRQSVRIRAGYRAQRHFALKRIAAAHIGVQHAEAVIHALASARESAQQQDAGAGGVGHVGVGVQQRRYLRLSACYTAGVGSP